MRSGRLSALCPFTEAPSSQSDHHERIHGFLIYISCQSKDATNKTSKTFPSSSAITSRPLIPPMEKQLMKRKKAVKLLDSWFLQKCKRTINTAQPRLLEFRRTDFQVLLFDSAKRFHESPDQTCSSPPPLCSPTISCGGKLWSREDPDQNSDPEGGEDAAKRF